MRVRTRSKRSEYQILEWDSNCFGYRVARIIPLYLTSSELQGVLSELSSEKVRLVYWFVDSQDRVVNMIAKEHGGFWVDEKITYVRDVLTSIKCFSSSKNIKSYLARPPNKQLVSLALQAGEHSRFKIDPHFVHNEFSNLYMAWLKNSLSGKIAKEVLVYKAKNRIVGFITIGVRNDRAEIGLVSVDRSCRGKSIGRRLVQAAMVVAKQLGYNTIQVVTQRRNKVACEFYKKLRFKVESVVNVYHFWLNG